ncbi:MAG: deoxyribodipyrimidine photolyase [Porticoccaceae bacterium]|nr:deoxyribodipyrimidine photolyase [Porticoccaceae bacterium]
MQLVWLRNDLRLGDNPALHGAAARRRGVLAVAALTPEQWRTHDESPARLAFWLANLRALQIDLQARNIGLQLLCASGYAELPPRLLALARENGVTGLWFNREYPLNEVRRDQAVTRTFNAAGITVNPCDGDAAVPPGHLLTQAGTPFRIFTPFAQAWRRKLAATALQPLPPPARQPAPAPGGPVTIPTQVPGWQPGYRDDLWPAGGRVAMRRLQDFLDGAHQHYADRRDAPGEAGTSRLSPYLNCGVLSARQCLAGVAARATSPEWITDPWVNEIAWRDFFRHLIAAFPDLSRWRPFRPEVETRIHWRNDQELWKAWTQGETGFPIVDAGMRELLATGWMHNRVRMITASFLTKLLGVDWRWGARFFTRHLIDGDFASNLGGWQWSASVGADAAPYFRIFNPTTQARRFDPNGSYLARWLPELARLAPRDRADPEAATAAGRRPPIIDYREARTRCLADYQAAGRSRR